MASDSYFGNTSSLNATANGSGRALKELRQKGTPKTAMNQWMINLQVFIGRVLLEQY